MTPIATAKMLMMVRVLRDHKLAVIRLLIIIAAPLHNPSAEHKIIHRLGGNVLAVEFHPPRHKPGHFIPSGRDKSDFFKGVRGFAFCCRDFHLENATDFTDFTEITLFFDSVKIREIRGVLAL
jgi:hypothetical protein